MIEEDQKGFETIFSNSGFLFSEDDNYLIHGVPTKNQGWVIHISSVTSHAESLLSSILPILRLHKLPFKVAKDSKTLAIINAGSFGLTELGKFITIYLDEEGIANDLVIDLKKHTSKIKGPTISTDYYLGDNIYCRYGTFIPNIKSDQYGNKLLLIQDGAGNFILDEYKLPPPIPNGVSIPFNLETVGAKTENKQILIHKKYFPVKLLKSDPKGYVWKCLRIGRYFIPTFCVVKQAKKGMHLDEYGRDMSDRLKFQFDVSRKISKVVATPVIFDFFDENEQFYIAMDYLGGSISFNKYIIKLHKRQAWFSLTKETQETSIRILKDIAQNLLNLHQAEYLNRDLNSYNVFVHEKNHRIYFLDHELSYSKATNQPDPPYGIGTPGYMSPEQEFGTEPPSEEDDIYSLGALGLFMVTSGIHSYYLDKNNTSVLAQRISLWTAEKELSGLIAQCLSPVRQERPNIETIIAFLSNYKYHSTANTATEMSSGGNELSETVQKGIKGLCTDTLMTKNNHWFSFTENDYGKEVYPEYDKHYFATLYRGSAGIIWLLSILKQNGYNISSAADCIENGLQFIYSTQIIKAHVMSPSLFYGSAGVALAVKEAVESGISIPKEIGPASIACCFQQVAESLDLFYGVAGQGISLLKCKEYLSETDWKQVLSHYVSIILSKQNKDGSWTTKVHANGKKEKDNSLSYGIAGIAYFLLVHSEVLSDKKTFDAGIKALKYLKKQRVRKENILVWPDSDINKSVSNFLCKGAPGIALAYLKAFKITADQQYLDIAKEALMINPDYYTNQKSNLCHGISGLGELYLEAYNITKDIFWYNRATWIYLQILSSQHETFDWKPYWLTDKNLTPTADLMTGNAGVLHFLARYHSPNRINFPIL